MVIERERSKTEVESLRWYVKDSTEILYHEWFYCSDLGTALPPVFARFFSSENFKTGAWAQRTLSSVCLGLGSKGGLLASGAGDMCTRVPLDPLTCRPPSGSPGALRVP